MTSAGHEHELELTEMSRELRAPRAAGIAGLVFAAFFIGSVLLLRNQPAAGSSADEIQRWYLRDNARHLGLVGLYLVPFAGIAFLWFMAVIRQNLGNREDRFFETVFLGSGLLFVAMAFAGAAVGGGPLAAVRFQHAHVPSPDTVTLVRGISYTLVYVYAVRAAAVFMVSVSTIAARTGALPRWFVVIGYVLAVALLVSVTFSRLVVLIFPLWVGAVSIAILLGSAGRRGAPGTAQ
jgi:hypothetical protein